MRNENKSKISFRKSKHWSASVQNFDFRQREKLDKLKLIDEEQKEENDQDGDKKKGEEQQDQEEEKVKANRLFIDLWL